MDVVEFGPLPEAQQDMWHAMIDLSEHLPGRWTLVGGQMVAERRRPALANPLRYIT